MGLFHPRIDTPPLTRNGRRARIGRVVPWVFIIGIAIGTLAGNRYWRNWLPQLPPIHAPYRPSGSDVWRNTAPDTPRPVTVLRTIDGDTFEARVTLSSGTT